MSGNPAEMVRRGVGVLLPRVLGLSPSASRGVASLRGVDDPNCIIGQPLAVVDRVAFEAPLPIDPLRSAAQPQISVVVMCGPRDQSLLDLCLEGILTCVGNPIQELRVVSPGAAASSDRYAHEVIADADVLPKAVAERLSRGGGVRETWLRQQFLKIALTLTTTVPATLIIDADTILLKRRSWYSGDAQLLLPAHEFHSPYHRVNATLLGGRFVPLGVSFVAHHQLMQRAVLSSYFGDTMEQFIARACEIVEAVDPEEQSCFSEYEFYANLLYGMPQVPVLGRWGNRAISRSRLGSAPTWSELSRGYSRCCSISCHGYLT